jgi:hypothetical protein
LAPAPNTLWATFCVIPAIVQTFAVEALAVPGRHDRRRGRHHRESPRCPHLRILAWWVPAVNDELDRRSVPTKSALETAIAGSL